MATSGRTQLLAGRFRRRVGIPYPSSNVSEHVYTDDDIPIVQVCSCGESGHAQIRAIRERAAARSSWRLAAAGRDGFPPGGEHALEEPALGLGSLDLELQEALAEGHE